MDHNASSTVACGDGYSGDITFTCSDGEVTDTGSCNQNCDAGSVTNGGATVEYGAMDHGTDSDVACGDGYIGTMTFTCTDGEVAESGTCTASTADDCDAGDETSNELVVSYDALTNGSDVTVECSSVDSGYTGSITFSCASASVTSDGSCYKNCAASAVESGGDSVDYDDKN
eukprot:UN23969